MANASLVQWLEYLPSKQVARVRFPDDAPFLHWDCGRHLRHHVWRHTKTQVHGGLAQSVECALCKREAPGSKPGFSTIFTVTPFALVAQMVERKTLNLVVVGSIPTEGVFTQRGFESPYLLHVVDNVKRSGPMV